MTTARPKVRSPEVRRLRAFARDVIVKTKHGPRQSGAPGACDSDCVKCQAEKILEDYP